GSTGRPKGVMIEHRNVCNYLQWAVRNYAQEQRTDAILSSSLAFDATVTSIYTALLSGGALRVVRDGDELTELRQRLCEEGGSLIKITPAHIEWLGAGR